VHVDVPDQLPGPVGRGRRRRNRISLVLLHGELDHTLSTPPKAPTLRPPPRGSNNKSDKIIF
jgi:hypothetical protein